MALARQTVALLQAARQLAGSLGADAVLLVTETDLDWADVRDHLGGCRLLVAAEDADLAEQLEDNLDLTVLNLDGGEASKQERISLALLEAVRTENVRHGADIVVLYNGKNDPDHGDPALAVRIDHAPRHRV